MQQPAADLSTTPAPSSGGSVLVKTTQIPLKNPVSGHRLKKVGLILVLIILGIGTLWAWEKFFKTKPDYIQKNVQNNQQESTKGGVINPNKQVFGRVINIDSNNRIIEVEAQSDSKKVYKIRVGKEIKIERLPVSDGKGGVLNMPATFETIRQDSIINILIKEDLNKSSEYNAINIILLV